MLLLLALVSGLLLVAGEPPLLLEDAALKALSSSSGDSCHVQVDCELGHAGLGDQLEHLVHYLHVSKLLNATCRYASDVFTLENRWAKETLAKSQHHGMSEYLAVAQLLGINTTNAVPFDEPFKRQPLTYQEAVELHERLQNGSALPACGTLYEVSLYSCKDARNHFCDFRLGYDSLTNVIWDLRRNAARTECTNKGLSLSRHPVHIVWHVRTGDVCLHCNASFASYYTDLAAKLKSLLKIPVRFIFEAQSHQVDFLKEDSIFKDAVFNTDAALMATVCRFLTSQILITTGSSFPVYLAAFSAPWSPIIIEEERKEADYGADVYRKHFFNSEEAILMRQGKLLLDDDALLNVFSTLHAA